MSSSGPSLERVRKGRDVRKVFTLEKASSHSLVHSNLTFFLGGEKEESLVSPVRKEARKGTKATYKMLYLTDLGWASHINDSLEFIRIGFNVCLYQHKSKEL